MMRHGFCHHTLAACFALLALLLSLAGCDPSEQSDPPTSVEGAVPREESALGKEFIARLARRDFAAIEAQLDPGLRSPETHEIFEKMAREIPAGEAKSMRTIGTDKTTWLDMSMNRTTTYTLKYEYEYAEGCMLAAVVLGRRDGALTLQGLKIERTDSCRFQGFRLPGDTDP